MDTKFCQWCDFQRMCFNTSVFFYALFLTLAIGCSKPTLTTDELLQKSQQAIADGQVQLACSLAEQIPAGTSEWIQVRFRLGEAFTNANKFEEAISWYLPVSKLKGHDEEAVRAMFYIAELDRELGRLSEAESKYNIVLADVGDDIAARERLAFLLTTTGRAWEATPHFFSIVQSGTASYPDLCLLGDLERRVDRLDYLRTCAANSPDDPVVQLGIAAHLYWEGNSVEAKTGLQNVLTANPNFLSGQAMLGELLTSRIDSSFLRWHDSLPSGASGNPGIWITRGLWARKQQEPEVAARCFWEALRLAPTSRRAMTQIAQVLSTLNYTGSAEFQNRASEMARLTQLIDRVLATEAKQEQQVRETAEILERTGRIWEACSWSVLAHKQFPDALWPEELFIRNSTLLTAELPMVVPSQDLTNKFDLSHYRGIEHLLKIERSQSTGSPEFTRAGRIQFSEEEQFPTITYFNSEDPKTPGARSFEQSGGGVGVIDADLDGVPDLFFPQGKEWMTGSNVPGNSPSLKDSLCRQSPRGSYADMTSVALPVDYGFGQGCAVGDFDNDGFADLYVANVGLNQLLFNQGDGTFTDTTKTAGLSATDWTASVVIADLNGDGFPELFDVNYLSGDGVYEAICNGKACSPGVFPGTPARLHINRQNGNFSMTPYGNNVRSGKGLGVVCLPMESPLFPSLFITNDQVANQLLLNSTSHSGAEINLDDQAFTMGTAYNGDGVAMAGMGIAAEDVDGNGTVDFYVTNFKDEPNTLLLQDAPGMFIDSTNGSGLKAGSLPYVGWGTQFIDADRDSLVDLLVANGHVDDYRGEGGEYQMQPQFFGQEHPGQFVELFAAQVGPFFEKKRLGRGLARLDWNQDGLMDFAVSHINDHAALVTNTTTAAGHFVNIRLIATTTARDAIGSIVTVTAADGCQWSKPLLAGDGYMASNERLLQFGLGSRTVLTKILVTWPSGASSMLESPTLNDTFLFVEGMPNVYLPNGEAEKKQRVEFTASKTPN